MRFNNYTELNAPIDHIYMVTNLQEWYRQPEPMKRDRVRRKPNKFCRYHNDIGHDTNNCFTLKDEIERFIKERRLQQYSKQNNERREENQQQPLKIQCEVRTIFGGPHVGGDSKRAQD
ncbi:hypothetical protein PanWU01x14_098340, partial [Parasponia andersonii]